MPEPRLIDSGPALRRAGLVHRLIDGAHPAPRPAIVMLHGWKGNEDVMWIFQRTLPAGWLVVAPRASQPDPDGGYTWYPAVAAAGWPDLAHLDEAVTQTAQFLDALPDLYGADPRRIYLQGFSQGAALAYALALRHPGRVQGIAGLVGFAPRVTPAELARQPLLDLPVFMAVGRQDDRIPPDIAAHCAATLRQAGADLTLREYDTGHKLNAAGMRDLRAWWAATANEALDSRAIS